MTQKWLRLIGLAAVVAAYVLPASAQTTWQPPVQCENPRERKEFRDLSDDERIRFFAALAKVMERPSEDKPSVYDRFASLHSKYAAETHSSPVFHPYHRALVHQMELELRRHDDTVNMPYWDSSLDSQAPELSPIFSDEWFGGNGVGPDKCVRDGQFKNFVPFYQDKGGKPKCLTRNFDNGNKIKPMAAVELVTKIVADAGNFTVFRKKTEGYLHGRVHNGIGGMMRTMHSPLDPFFYFHHAFIDKIYFNWQQRNPKLRQYMFHGLDAKTGKRTSKNDFMRPPVKHIRVGDALDTRANGMCYIYVEPSIDTVNAASERSNKAKNAAPIKAKLRRRSDPEDEDVNADADADDSDDDSAESKIHDGDRYKRAPSGGDRTFITELRPPAEIPEEWARMNGLDIDELRADEREAAETCNQLNKVDGYVSPCALWNRPELLRGVAKEVSVFRVYIHGRVVSVSNKDVEDGLALDSDGHIAHIKEKFEKAGLKVMKTVREQARKLRRILGGGFDRMIERFETHLEKFSSTAKNIYDKTKQALLEMLDSKDSDGYDEDDGDVTLAQPKPSAGKKPCNKKKQPQPPKEDENGGEYDDGEVQRPVVPKPVKKPCNKTRQPEPIAKKPCNKTGKPAPVVVPVPSGHDDQVQQPYPAKVPKPQLAYSEDEPTPTPTPQSDYSEDEPTSQPQSDYSEDEPTLAPESDQPYSEEDPEDANSPANYQSTGQLVSKPSSGALVSGGGDVDGQKSDAPSSPESDSSLGMVAADQPAYSE